MERDVERDEAEEKSRLQSETNATSEPMDLRTKLGHLIHSHKFMVSIVVLVVLDCVMVLAALVFDLELVKLAHEHHYVPHIFHYCSLAILSLFLIELAVRIFVLRLDFFKHKLELFDAVVVVVSWVLDIVFRDNNDLAVGAGLLILLRLWRVTRIINGIVVAVQIQAEEKIEKERHLREAAEEEFASYSRYCNAMETRMRGLEQILHNHSIDFLNVEKIAVEKPKERTFHSNEKKKRHKENALECMQEMDESLEKGDNLSGTDRSKVGARAVERQELLEKIS